MNLWNLETSPSTKLVHAGSGNITSGQDPGFFTSVSSSGSNDAIIWAVSRPVSSTNTAITLYAMNAQPSSGALPLLFSQGAGSWTHLGGNANIVPVVANGHVYVASYKRLSIFGLLSGGAASLNLTADPAAPSVVSDSSQHEMFGTISTVSGLQLTVQTRTGSLINVDASLAIQNDLCIDLEAGGAVDVQGTFDANGVLQATSIQRAKDSPDLWPADI